MGVWMIGKGDISINPPVDEELIKEYIQFSKRYIPEEYRDEWFPNPWFFDENNKLISIAGKFAEPSIWYRHIKKEFFEPRGYELEGNVEFPGDMDSEFWKTCEEVDKKYRQWKMRMDCYDIVGEGTEIL